jgi:Gpi18-like mannosyltransferase
MILADIALAIITYLLCKRQSINWKKYVLSFLFLPFSWYLSAIWGQSDQLSFVFLILSVILLLNNKNKKLWLSPLFFALSINLKPTGLILVPLYLWIWFRQKKSWTNLLIGGLVSILGMLYLVSLFTSGSPISYLEHLYNRIFLILKPIITVNSLTFWRLFILGKADAITNEIVLQRITILGYIIYFFVSIISFLIVKFKNKESILASLFISSFGGWLFLTNMHERYLFMGIMFLLFFSIYRPKYFRYFIALSTIYFISMYLAFQAVPIPFLNKIPIFSWLLSAANLVFYIKITRKMFRELY